MAKRIIVLISILSLTSTCFSQRPRDGITGRYLLKTKWGGAKPFNMFAPNGSTLGCHSTAFAQALYFHRLAPRGKVSYKCSDGTMISEVFSDYNPRWNKFALKKNPAKKDDSSIREASKFMYYVASVVRKDFGTDQYVDYPNDGHKKAIESHFRCTLTAYPKEVKTNISRTLKEETDFYALLKTEINSNRPVGFYYTDRKGGGHAVVIDGHVEKNDKTYFHVNFGWCGSSDGWYLLAEDLPRNTKEIVVIRILPINTENDKK